MSAEKLIPNKTPPIVSHKVNQSTPQNAQAPTIALSTFDGVKYQGELVAINEGDGVFMSGSVVLKRVQFKRPDGTLWNCSTMVLPADSIQVIRVLEKNDGALEPVLAAMSDEEILKFVGIQPPANDRQRCAVAARLLHLQHLGPTVMRRLALEFLAQTRLTPHLVRSINRSARLRILLTVLPESYHSYKGETFDFLDCCPFAADDVLFLQFTDAVA